MTTGLAICGYCDLHCLLVQSIILEQVFHVQRSRHSRVIRLQCASVLSLSLAHSVLVSSARRGGSRNVGLTRRLGVGNCTRFRHAERLIEMGLLYCNLYDNQYYNGCYRCASLQWKIQELH